MAVYVELRYKAFHQQMQRQTRNLTRKTWNVKGIRRPLDGITIKDDTYGFMRVVTEDGRELTLSGNSNIPYAGFLVTHWDQPQQEKMSILETMGDTDYLYFYGRKVRSYTINGVLLNTEDFNWKTRWLVNYDQYLRGTQLAKSRARMYLYVDGSVIEGYLANTSIANDQGQRNMVSFSSMVLVTDYLDVDTFYVPEGRPTEYITGLPDGEFPEIQGDIRKAYGWTYDRVFGVAGPMIKAQKVLEDSEPMMADPYTDSNTSEAEVVGKEVMPKEGDAGLVHPSEKRSIWAIPFET